MKWDCSPFVTCVFIEMAWQLTQVQNYYHRGGYYIIYGTILLSA